MSIGKAIGYDKIVNPDKPLAGWHPMSTLEEGIAVVISKAKEYIAQSGLTDGQSIESSERDNT